MAEEWQLTTPRLLLRRVTPADRPALRDMLGDFEVTKNLAVWSHPVDSDRIDSVIARHATDDPGGFGITYAGSLAGMISAGPNIGYFLARPFWGLGIMTEALAAVSKRALDLHPRLTSGAFEDNHASHKVLEKCGFVRDGESMVTCAARGCQLRSLDYARVRDGAA